MRSFLTLKELREPNPLCVQAFTFGVGHEFRDCIIFIEAHSEGECRNQMVERFGVKWSIQYPVEHAIEMVQKYNLQVLTMFPRDMLKLIAELEDNER